LLFGTFAAEGDKVDYTAFATPLHPRTLGSISRFCGLTAFAQRAELAIRDALERRPAQLLNSTPKLAGDCGVLRVL